MSEATLEWRNYRYFPYEREFARLEAAQLFTSSTNEDESGIRIPAAQFKADEAERLTYFARAVDPRGDVVIPRQARLEASARIGNSERQATRYSAHALHEYKGRFNPQVVRAIGNILGLSSDAWVLDPFCGSGTTLLECLHSGWNAIGVDRNPLAVRIATAKLRAFRRADFLSERAAVVAETLLERFESLSGATHITPKQIVAALGPSWQEDIPFADYLSEWFTLPVLAQLVATRRTLHTLVRSADDRAIFEIVLSDQLRAVSLQEPLDLRIRRRKDPQPNYPLIAMFVEALLDRFGRVKRARTQVNKLRGQQTAVLGDTRGPIRQRGVTIPREGFDAVITSPPYETALPYIDTQRLSLVLLGELSPTELARTEKELIGAREISTTERRSVEERIRAGDESLPREVMELCRELLCSASADGNGFRRRNRPALLYRYFKSMSSFFENLRGAMRPGAKIAMVVGTNRTTLNGREYLIDTPNLLRAVGQSCGFTPLLERRMDTYQRYDIHQKNSIDSEVLLVLEAP